ncbi:helix-turn-helix domain-containing protein [Nitratidesulfovibrio termitidis]|nr:helix-turn-helix domain-containing protein [Nitratidesulfovibrio termitidis]
MCRVYEVTGTSVQKDLARVLGIGQSSVSIVNRTGNIPADWLLTLLRSHGINPDWILTGTGPRLVWVGAEIDAASQTIAELRQQVRELSDKLSRYGAVV